MDERPPFTIRDALVHRRFLLLAIVALFLLGAGALSLRPPTYEASTLLYVDTSRTAPGFDLGIATGELLQHDFIVLATSRPVLQAACAAPGVSCAPDDPATPQNGLAKRINVSVYKGTSSLAVAAKAPNPALAAALSNAVAVAMIDRDRAEVTRLFKAALDDVEKRLSDLRTAMDKEQQALQKSPNASSTAASHQAALAGLQAQYTTTLTHEQNLIEQQNRSANIATIQEAAVPPLRPVSPDPLRYLAAALIAGLAFGALAALVAERFDDRIRTAEGLARATGVSVALVAGSPRRRRPALPPAYSLAFASLLTRPSAGNPVLVTAASARDHSEAVAEALGVVAANAGQRVVVVQSDGHTVDPGRFLRRDDPEITTITVASSNGAGAAAAVAEVEKQYELDASNLFVLVAVPSPDISPAAMMVSRTARRAVITATAGVTRFKEARRTADLLRASGVDLVAGVLLTHAAA
jgi:capsular polysaccharide biosynthesis protein